LADVNETLAERGSRYGDFATHAKITQGLKEVFVDSPKWRTLTASMKEALDMVAHKIGRILNGDPTYGDSWHDIAGYATLVEQELADAPEKAPEPVVGVKSGPVDVIVAGDNVGRTQLIDAPPAPPQAPSAPLPPPVVAPSAPLPPLSPAPSAPVAPLKVPPKVTK
jgi:hypothetical protein